jgi:hypothetical protein
MERFWEACARASFLGWVHETPCKSAVAPLLGLHENTKE